MKKTILVLTAILLSWQLPVFAAPDTMVVSAVTGQPQILRGGEMLPAQTGTICQTGDVLMTSTPGCSLDVSVNGLAGCRVLPSSECVIVNGSPSDMHLKINSGNAILNLKKIPAGSSFKVETPTAVAAVRGTQFWGRVDTQNPNSPITTFAVREGIVEIFAKNAGKSFTLKPGQALDIPTDASITPSIRPALDAEMKAMEQARSISTSA